MERGKEVVDASPSKEENVGVIWKESPVEKKLQPSGNGNPVENATELRGFVSSLITSPSPSKQTSSKFKFNKIINSSNVRSEGINRHIVFSPDKEHAKPPIVPLSSPNQQNKRQKSQDQALLSILEKMEDAYSDSPEKQPPKAPESPKNDVDMDMSDESWDLLLQVEMQATQQYIEQQKKTEESPGDANRAKERTGISPAVLPRRTIETTLKQPASKPSDYIRLIALEVHCDNSLRQLLIRAIGEDDAIIDVVMADDWFDTPIQVGDAFNFIWTAEITSTLIANNSANLIILHPDILVSPTSVTSSLGCARRAVLQKTLSLNQSSGPSALVGVLKHELFERALNSGLYSIPYLIEQSKDIIQQNLLKCLEAGLTGQQVAEEMKASFQSIHSMLNRLHTTGIQVTDNQYIRLERVLATEEPLWSIKYGINGTADSSIRIVLNNMPSLVPLELKTGKRIYNEQEHRGQVLLYTLLLEERYHGCSQGLLMYLLTNESVLVSRPPAIIRALLLSRNDHAHQLAAYHNLSTYPPLLKNPWDCSKCFQAAECMLHHAAEENGSVYTSGVEEVFLKHTSHLSPVDLAYFAKWNRLIDLEFRKSQTAVQQLWLYNNDTRIANGMCIANLELKSMANSIVQFDALDQPSLLTQDLKFQIEDRVIVSAETNDTVVLHVAKGKLLKISAQSISIALFSPISSAVLKGESIVGDKPRWRIDKDMLTSGLHQAKRSLVALFVGSSPQDITAGLKPGSNPTIYTSDDSHMGDIKRRHLICRLQPPRFHAEGTTLSLLQAHYKENPMGAPYEPLYQAFLGMNSDQQRAIEKVLHAKDYALILGMPGTGKTSAITMCVRLLLYLGFSVLVTSYTHSAVDTLLLKLLDHDVPMLRVGNKDQVHARLVPHLIESKISTMTTTAEIEELFLQSQLVGCTCLSTNHVLFSKRRFDYCIVDEASQITQPVVLGALRTAEVFCLVGDHYQLPPLVTDAKAKAGGLDVSLFKRLSEAHPNASVQLGFQYRMHRDIMLLCNTLIYNHQLKCGNQETKPSWAFPASSTVGAASWIRSILTAEPAVVFIDTDDIGFLEEKTSKGLINQIEADAIVQLVMRLQRSNVNDVGVLSPFRSQVHYLQSKQSTQMASIEISTIDKYQGRDKDVILVSFVRSNANKNVGELLLDWRRINVALSRAKKKLIMFGSSSTLSTSPILKSLIELVKAQKWIFPLPPAAITINPSSQAAPMAKKRAYAVMSNDGNAIENLVPGIISKPPRPIPPVSRNILDTVM
ncbi:DNA2-like helicase [Thraustotheca clavata]|uniref:DNA replication ATP-dependent helicase/nuclease n=1 Tax=Thraustotheca clavata TaxID=74557 RepID=A0A1W0A2Z6_9STRA|nr:DNA2-like helicase [Thraustotheca clavata]